MSDTPETKYVKNGDVNIAYQVSGSGSVDLVCTGMMVSHLELEWEFGPTAAFYTRLGAFARLIRMDRRGVGLSDRRTPASAIEEEVGDIGAVMDAATSFRAYVLGSNEGVTRAAMFAATHPARVTGLILYGGFAKSQPSQDFEAAPPGLVDTLVASVEETWGARASVAGRTVVVAPAQATTSDGLVAAFDAAR